MKKKFEEPEMTIVVFGSDDTLCVTSGLDMATGMSMGGYDVDAFTVLKEPDDD